MGIVGCAAVDVSPPMFYRRRRLANDGERIYAYDNGALRGGEKMSLTRGVYPYLSMATNAPWSILGDEQKV